MATPNPFDTVQQVAGGYGVARCLHVVADLGIADHLGDAPRTIGDIARDAQVHADALGRVLRLLSAHGIFQADGDKVAHSPASRLLRSDHPQSMRAFARMIGSTINWTVYGAMEHAVRTGHPASETVLPNGYWDYYASHPDAGRIFNQAMQAKARGHVAAVIGSYDFSAFATVADIGGGRGHMLRAIVESTSHARGILFDLPRVIEDVADVASARITLHGGDFFRDALPVCDAYVAMDIIHDWDDDEALAILKAIRRAAPSHATLLLLETMISDDAGPDWATMLDIHMLVLLGGRQRTRREYERLLDAAHFTLNREIDTRAGISILEAESA